MKSLTRSEEVILVSVWRLQGKAYGVTIRREVMRVLGDDLSYGFLYNVLDRLTRNSLLLKAAGESVTARLGRRRMYYTLSPQGVRILERSNRYSKLSPMSGHELIPSKGET